MARLIYADEFERALKDDIDFAIQGKGRNGDMEVFIPRSDVIGMLKQQPTIDPMKHGEWEEMRDAYGELEGWIHAECGREVKCMENFCPHCGARMDGD